MVRDNNGVSNIKVTDVEVSNTNVSTTINNQNLDKIPENLEKTQKKTEKEVSNTNVSTLINKYSGVFLVRVSNVSNSNLTEHLFFGKGGCYLYVSNLTRILNLLTNPTNTLIIYTLTHLDYSYYNMFYKILKIDLIKIKRALSILEREGVVVQTKRNKYILMYLEHLSTQKTIGQYHLNKIVFYSLSNHYKPFFEELMELFEKDLPKQVVNNVKDYKRELRKSRSKIDKLIDECNQQERIFIEESVKILKDNPHFLDGRVRLYNNTFGQNLTKNQFQIKLIRFGEYNG